MELKNVNPKRWQCCNKQSKRGQLLFFENCRNQFQKQTSYVAFLSKRCHDCPKKNLHIIHFSNQHWMNKCFPYYSTRDKIDNFLKVFWFFCKCPIFSLFCLGPHNFVFELLVKKKNYTFTKLVHSYTSKKSFKKSQWKIDIVEPCPNFQLSHVWTMNL
jgi:hypothetical protein